MTDNNKKNIFRILIIAFLVLIGTNLATYYLAGRGAGQATGDEPTVIKYEPVRREIEADVMVIQEALNTITDYYFSPVEKEELIEGALRGMIESIGDPQVRFFDNSELEVIMNDTKGK